MYPPTGSQTGPPPLFQFSSSAAPTPYYYPYPPPYPPPPQPYAQPQAPFPPPPPPPPPPTTPPPHPSPPDARHPFPLPWRVPGMSLDTPSSRITAGWRLRRSLRGRVAGATGADVSPTIPPTPAVALWSPGILCPSPVPSPFPAAAPSPPPTTPQTPPKRPGVQRDRPGTRSDDGTDRGV